MDAQQSLIAAIHENVQLHDDSPLWPSLHEAERQRLLSLLPSVFLDVQHIGSTSIPGMVAKPIIGILAGVDAMEAARSITAKLCSSGYTTSAAFNESLSDRQWLMRWVDGHRTHLLHVVVHGSNDWMSVCASEIPCVPALS